MASRAARRRLAAGASSGVWKAVLTFKGRTRLAPASCNILLAASSAAEVPAITVCVGVLKLAGQTSSSPSIARWTASGPIPSTAAIEVVPGGAALPMAQAYDELGSACPGLGPEAAIGSSMKPPTAFVHQTMVLVAEQQHAFHAGAATLQHPVVEVVDLAKARLPGAARPLAALVAG